MAQKFRKLGPDQPCQRICPPHQGAAYCAMHGVKISHLAPQRPLCVECWAPFSDRDISEFRDMQLPFCHRCGERFDYLTYASPLCERCCNLYAAQAA